MAHQWKRRGRRDPGASPEHLVSEDEYASGYPARKQRVRLGCPARRIPQYIEVPPNIEVKQIIITFHTVLPYQSNPSFLQDDSKIQLFSGYWQAICSYELYDSDLNP
jgi:hypothetical protein